MSRPRYDKISIKWRLFLYLLGFIAIPVALIWIFQILFQGALYTQIKVGNVENSAEAIAENIDNTELSALIDRIARQENVRVGLYDAEGNPVAVVAEAQPLPGVTVAGPSPVLDTEQAQQAYDEAEQGGGLSVEFYDTQPPPEFEENADFVGNVPPRDERVERNVTLSRIVPSDEGDMLLVLTAPVTPIHSTIRILQVQLVWITILLLALCLGLAFIMSRRISRPIIQTTASAKELAKGNYDTAFNAHGYREIVELNDTLDYAAGELSKTEKLRQELIANVSHDLRTPLTLITGYAEAMRDIPGENTPQNTQVIIEEAKRLSGLVSDMLDISRIQSGAANLNTARFNLTQCVRGIMQRYAKLVEQDGYAITFGAEKDTWVDADQTRISQVVYNLINNAVNYTGVDKKVAVRQTVANGNVRIEVEDTGSGIARKDLPYIWDRYYKVDKTHKRAAVGTGLGLSIVRAVLEQHKAQYGVQSEEGQGSVFWFELPVRPEMGER